MATNSATASPANVTVTSGLSFAANSTLLLDVGGANPGTNYDRINITGGSPALGGTLQIAVRNGFVPTLGQRIVILNSTTA